MLHNSLYRRDLLRSMNKHPLVVHRRDVHRNVARRTDPKPTASQIALADSWAIQTARALKPESLVAADAADFLTILGVPLSDAAPNQLLIELGSCDAGFRTLVEPGRIELHAADAGALWSGWTHLENQMRAAGSPVLTKGETLRRPAWGVQIAPPTWGSNYAVPDLSPDYLPDGTFRSLAHAGANGMFIYGDWNLYATGTALAELNHPDAGKNLRTLKEAAGRAAGYGVRLYFVLVSPKLPADHPLFKRLPGTRGARLAHDPHSSAPPIHCLCSSDPDALAFHAAAVGGLFREVPDLGGIICIIGGESYYHCFMRSAGSAVGDTNCPHCKGKRAEDVIANLLKVTADAAHQYTPDAKVMAWPYSAQYFWSHDRDQFDLIERLPDRVDLLSEIDKEQLMQKEGYQKLCWDYSVDFDGHSDRIVAQALRCAERGRDLAVKTETAHGIELLHLPYVPGLTRSARKWQSVRAVRPAAVLQRWGFIGMYDSAAERIGYQARWDPSFTPDAACAFVARQLVGPDLAPQVVAAWREFDHAVGHLPTLVTGGYYKGPLFLGPGCPLPVWTGPTPAAFLGNFFYLAEAEPTGDSSRKGAHDDFTIHAAGELAGPPLAVQEAEYAAARDHAAAGHALLQKLDASKLDPATRDELAEQQAVGEYLYRTFVTCHNLVRFLRLRDTAKAPKADLVSLVRDELVNTTAARSLYERAPWLNHSLRLDVGAPESLAMCAEKIRLLQGYVKS